LIGLEIVAMVLWGSVWRQLLFPAIRKDWLAPATEDSLDLRPTTPTQTFRCPGTPANHPDAESGRTPHPAKASGSEKDPEPIKS
jgi:hypothetical protein